jgi:pimeloyl-ACP methyl ester carboxylesterase
MNTVRSQDGTRIAYDRQGDGPALVIVDGAMSARMSKMDLADLLAQQFTVYRYDRRGRGDSGDTQPYAVEREVEDIAAVIAEAAGTPFLYGHSSGGSLAMEAAVELGGAVRGLAMYEAPYSDDPAAQVPWREYLDQLAEALAADRRGDAVALFMQYVGMSAEQVAGMRHAPFWAGLEALAPTMAYDHAGIIGPDRGVPTERAARVPVPTLVLRGSAGDPAIGDAARRLSQAIPRATLRTLEGQTHDVQAAALAPVLAEFFSTTLAGAAASPSP